MGRKSAKKAIRDELDIERHYIHRIWNIAKEYTKKLNKHELNPALRLIHEEQDAYLLLLNATVNKQRGMAKKGIPFPEGCNVYQREVEDFKGDEPIGKAQVSIEDTYVRCRRCEFKEKDDRGQHYCTVWKWRIDNTRFYTAPDDGCSRGLLAEEYR